LEVLNLNKREVLKLIEKLKISKCPDCGNHEIQVHTDRFFIVNTLRMEACELKAQEDPTESDEVTEIICRKCGNRLTALQDIIIFKTAIMEQLKNRLKRQPTTEEFLNYVEALETDLPAWLQYKTLDIPTKTQQHFF
jgi:predicted nucleic-acid-binding Zn-ribbon protein